MTISLPRVLQMTKSKMKVLSVFNNKGGVGKTTLTFHMAHALAEMGKRVLLIDADPQCNLTIFAMEQDELHDIWSAEDGFIENGFESESLSRTKAQNKKINSSIRSLHYILKPVEDGISDVEIISPPKKIAKNLDLVPGRLTLHLYEEKVAERWAGAYRGDPLAIRTITKIRELAQRYDEKYSYDFIIVDTSPSLGSLNKIVISTVDGFIVPATPDLFSLYGIRNLGHALGKWKSEFDVIFTLISQEKRKAFPRNFVNFLGYTIFNAKKRSDGKNIWSLARAHYNYASQIPSVVKEFIPTSIRKHLDDELANQPIGGLAVMHTHNTFPAMAQKYNLPMWKIPSHSYDIEDKPSIQPNGEKYEATLHAYKEFSADLLNRISLLED